mgnify:CR=1 FL=1
MTNFHLKFLHFEVDFTAFEKVSFAPIFSHEPLASFRGFAFLKVYLIVIWTPLTPWPHWIIKVYNVRCN